jgi:hypothetical protein
VITVLVNQAAGGGGQTFAFGINSGHRCIVSYLTKNNSLFKELGKCLIRINISLV